MLYCRRQRDHGSPLSGVALSGNAYAGSTFCMNYETMLKNDWVFRVTPVGHTGEVPEPNTLALLGVGLGLAGLRLARRRAHGKA